jgi:hypothetical protein
MLPRMTSFVAARHRDTLLPALRTSTAAASDVLWCVAFVSVAGVHLVARELEQVRGHRRLLATGVFGGDTRRAALTEAGRLGMDMRVLNLGGGTYHPKIYLFDGSSRRGVIGSGNLTGGLVCNAEAGLWLDAGPALDDAWLLGEELWEHPDSTPWRPEALVPPVESMSEQLFRELLASLEEGQSIPTLGRSQLPNKIVSINMDTLWVETEATAAKGRSAAPVPGWMLQLAYDRLRSHGTLTNTTLLNDLRVHRSSFVCAALAHLPGVTVSSRAPSTLKWQATPPASPPAAPLQHP